MRSHLNNGEIVLMTSLGYSGSGDVFNVQSEAVAARAAAALGATKLIYLTPLALVQRVRRSEKKGEESVRYGVPTRGLEEMGYEVRRPPPPLPTPTRPRATAAALNSLPQPRSKEALKALKARPPSHTSSVRAASPPRRCRRRRRRRRPGATARRRSSPRSRRRAVAASPGD